MKKLTPLFTSTLFFVILAAATGGSVAVAAKYALQVFKPFTVVVIRFLCALLTLLPFIIKSKELRWNIFRQTLPVALIGAFNPILLFIALQFTKASISPLIYAGVPALTAAYIFLVKHQPLEQSKVLGIITGLVGVSIIVVLPLFQFGAPPLSLLGNALIFLASLAFMVYGLLSKEKQHELGITPLALTFYFCVVTLLVSLPFASYEVWSMGIPNQVSPVQWLSGVYAGVIGTGVFYLSYQYALKHGSAVTASLFTYLQPLFGLSFAALLLGETISITFLVGGALAAVGAHLASRPAPPALTTKKNS